MLIGPNAVDIVTYVSDYRRGLNRELYPNTYRS
jgi:hypothetical protein